MIKASQWSIFLSVTHLEFAENINWIFNTLDKSYKTRFHYWAVIETDNHNLLNDLFTANVITFISSALIKAALPPSVSFAFYKIHATNLTWSIQIMRKNMLNVLRNCSNRKKGIKVMKLYLPVLIWLLRKFCCW